MTCIQKRKANLTQHIQDIQQMKARNTDTVSESRHALNCKRHAGYTVSKETEVQNEKFNNGNSIVNVKNKKLIVIVN